jgi:hypothetical protein
MGDEEAKKKEDEEDEQEVTIAVVGERVLDIKRILSGSIPLPKTLVMFAVLALFLMAAGQFTKVSELLPWATGKPMNCEVKIVAPALTPDQPN